MESLWRKPRSKNTPLYAGDAEFCPVLTAEKTSGKSHSPHILFTICTTCTPSSVCCVCDPDNTRYSLETPWSEHHRCSGLFSIMFCLVGEKTIRAMWSASVRIRNMEGRTTRPKQIKEMWNNNSGFRYISHTSSYSNPTQRMDVHILRMVSHHHNCLTIF